LVPASSGCGAQRVSYEFSRLDSVISLFEPSSLGGPQVFPPSGICFFIFLMTSPLTPGRRTLPLSTPQRIIIPQRLLPPEEPRPPTGRESCGFLSRGLLMPPRFLAFPLPCRDRARSRCLFQGEHLLLLGPPQGAGLIVTSSPCQTPDLVEPPAPSFSPVKKVTAGGLEPISTFRLFPQSAQEGGISFSPSIHSSSLRFLFLSHWLRNPPRLSFKLSRTSLPPACSGDAESWRTFLQTREFRVSEL